VNGFSVSGPLGLELGLAVLMLLVFFVGLFTPSGDKRRVGVLSAIGLVLLFGLAWRAEGGTEMFRGALVQDELALFAKRLFLLATLIGVLASLPLRAAAFARRARSTATRVLKWLQVTMTGTRPATCDSEASSTASRSASRGQGISSTGPTG